MKKYIIAVLLLITLGCLSAEATTWTRMRFRAYGYSGWASGTINDQGYLESIINNGAYTYTITTDYGDGGTYVGMFTIDIRPDTCSQSTPQVGYFWKETSSNGGVNWALVQGSFISVNMGSVLRETTWTCTASGPLTVWSYYVCPF